METFTIPLTEQGDVTLTAYLQMQSPYLEAYATRPAVLICPGGAYRELCDREGEPIALSFLAQGYQAFVLKYSIGEGKVFEDALRDAETALHLIRERAAEWRVQPIILPPAAFPPADIWRELWASWAGSAPMLLSFVMPVSWKISAGCSPFRSRLFTKR